MNYQLLLKFDFLEFLELFKIFSIDFTFYKTTMSKKYLKTLIIKYGFWCDKGWIDSFYFIFISLNIIKQESVNYRLFYFQ